MPNPTNQSDLVPGISRLRLRPMLMTDLHGVRQLEKVCYSTPWPERFFRRLLRSHASCWVYEQNGAVVGYGIVQSLRGWAHIMNLCIAPTHRRQGLGKRMLLHLMREGRRYRAQRAWLEVRTANQRAIALYRRLGFSVRYRRKRYYRTSPQRQRDALVMIGSLVISNRKRTGVGQGRH